MGPLNSPGFWLESDPVRFSDEHPGGSLSPSVSPLHPSLYLHTKAPLNKKHSFFRPSSFGNVNKVKEPLLSPLVLLHPGNTHARRVEDINARGLRTVPQINQTLAQKPWNYECQNYFYTFVDAFPDSSIRHHQNKSISSSEVGMQHLVRYRPPLFRWQLHCHRLSWSERLFSGAKTAINGAWSDFLYGPKFPKQCIREFGIAGVCVFLFVRVDLVLHVAYCATMCCMQASRYTEKLLQ